MENRNAWEKVLMDRVEELRSKEQGHKQHISHIIADFKEWVAEASEFDIYYDAEYKAQQIAEARETYKAVWHRYKEAEAELERYREIMKGE